jgi:hypothetical protein
MSTADAPDRSEAARSAAQARWGSRVPERAAEVVIARHSELPAEVRDRVHEATGSEEDVTDG